MKFVTILGARPQFIKAAALSRKVANFDNINEIIIHTGQHYDDIMSKIFFDELNIPLPDLLLATGGKGHGEMTGLQLIEIEKSLIKYKPDFVLVYGDTNSTLAGALSAAKLNIPVAHVEAGLRSYNKKMPEEINRVLTDHMSEILFAPSALAVDNLKKESLLGNSHLVGDIMYDASKYYLGVAEKKCSILKEINLDPKEFALVTIHRQENTDDFNTLNGIVSALVNLSKRVKLVFPIHPRTKNKLLEFELFNILSSNLMVIDPVGYLDMLILEKNSNLVITDSGGVQKEAYFNDVRCIVLRNETEWSELVDMRYNRLIKSDELCNLGDIYDEFISEDIDAPQSIYGNGDTSSQILETLLSEYS